MKTVENISQMYISHSGIIKHHSDVWRYTSGIINSATIFSDNRAYVCLQMKWLIIDLIWNNQKL